MEHGTGYGVNICHDMLYSIGGAMNHPMIDAYHGSIHNNVCYG